MSDTGTIEAVRDTLSHHKRPASSDGIATDRLRSLVERIERMDEERRERVTDIQDIYKEAKSAGFDIKVLRRLIAERRQDPNELDQQESLLDLYRRQIGM